MTPADLAAVTGRTPHGVRGLKWHAHLGQRASVCRRTPHGVRGLKCEEMQRRRNEPSVAPRMGCVD